ncbi:helix-turn-helix domain-containing protein [Paenibacillus glycinis]|uniref:Helix-turn-helix domain-containing protein n=1 Tax=Paenibacillus glycinis TaxID=2697035 RepID=A0ABW9XSB3_9BACL|nr:helix-turn-helix transcriptional regulator [Paenibacillus glycinis]NBD25549.1 helix-turn-helix domain-containing protein [Paenibacillus glycinis]
MDAKDKFRHRLRQRRKEFNLTQAELAESAGLSAQMISNWERGYTQPNKDEIMILVWQLGLGADYLLGVTDKAYDLNRANIDLIELLNSEHRIFFRSHALSVQQKQFISDLLTLTLNQLTEDR